MASAVMDPNLATALDLIGQGLDALHAVGVNPLDGVDARVLISEVEVVARRVRAAQLELVAAIDRRGLHRADGHASAKVLVRHVAKLSDAEAGRRDKAAKALRDLPAVAEAFEQGRVGACQVDRIARVHGNRRVRCRLLRQDHAMVELAERLEFTVFDQVMCDWTRRADEDGTCDRSQRDHEDRDAAGSWHTYRPDGTEIE